MKKRVKSFLVVACLAAFMLMAVGSSPSNSNATKEIVKTQEETVVEDVVSENNMDTSAEKSTVESTSNVTIEEQVLFDQEGIIVTAKEYVTEDFMGDGIKLLIENNSDKTVMVGCTALIVNNYMIQDLFASEIAAGKKANEIMYLSSSQLKEAGIDSVGQVEMYFHIYDSSTYEDFYNSDCITIKTSEFDTMDTTPADVGMELYNENGIKIVGKAVNEKSFWGTAILLYCENKSGKNVGISVEEMSINGFMMSPYFSTTVYDNKMSIDDITILSSDLETNGIESIEDVELKFHIYDSATLSTIDDSDAIKFSAN